MSTRRSDREFRLQCVVADHLRLAARPGVYWTAIPMGELRAKKTAAKIKRMGAQAGAPDILLIINGGCYGLELKANKKGRQSEAQKATERAWISAGGIYTVAYGIDDALSVLTAWGALRKQDRVPVADMPFKREWVR